MWFDEVMDDCKQALKIALNNKSIFIPIFVSAGITVLVIIFAFLIFSLGIAVNVNQISSMITEGSAPIRLIISALIGLLVLYLFVSAAGAMLGVGSINMYKAAVEGIKPTSQHFFEGAKRYFGRVWGAILLIHLLMVIFIIPIIAIFLLYSLTIGILTAGWGVIILFALVGVYFGAWMIAVVEDDIGAFEAIGTSIRFGKQSFWELFIISLAGIFISRYVTTAFGSLVSLIIGWFFASAVLAYFKVVILLVYKRKKSLLL